MCGSIRDLQALRANAPLPVGREPVGASPLWKRFLGIVVDLNAAVFRTPVAPVKSVQVAFPQVHQDDLSVVTATAIQCVTLA